MKNLLNLRFITLVVIVMLCSIEATCNSDLDLLGGAYVTLADKFGGEISTEDLSTVKELGIAGCAAGSKVYTFNLEIKINGGLKKFVGESNTLSEEIIAAFGKLKKGDSFIFTKIRAHLPSGGKIDALGRTFTVI